MKESNDENYTRIKCRKDDITRLNQSNVSNVAPLIRNKEYLSRTTIVKV